ncbi:MAG: glycosyltransferase family 4 protein [Chloroflexi bacterium]|nr:glycosyltransferase family 4 protein [Chloroflexota bacterium]
MHLILFFTRGVSLQTWASVGSLEREIALYLRLGEKGVHVTFITYGGSGDLQYASQHDGIEILCNRWNLPPRWYERLLPFLHARILRSADVIKTNQTNGADLALRAARIWRKPLIARCGYMWSEFAQRRGATNEVELARKIEQHVFESAQRVIVTTPAMKMYVEEKYNVSADRVVVFPNYVLTDLFSPGQSKADSNQLCSIGRLNEQKNLHSLLQACEGLDVELHLIGEGHLRASLQEQANRLKINLVLHGNLPHHELPEMIRQSSIFALVSFYEGHPKALLEAMSCGAAVLVANSPGIREQIVHGETGWLVEPDIDSIREGIQHLVANQELRNKFGRNARNYILETCSLDRIVEMEYSLLGELVGDVR